MINPILKIISKFYNEDIESISVKILYFFNTIDTYFLFGGILSFILAWPREVNVAILLLSLFFAIVTAKIADFYPNFVIYSVPVLIVATIILPLPVSSIKMLFLINTCLFFIIQFIFMGIPDSIVARDIRVPFIKIFNSLFTIAPTTVSFPISVFFSFYVSFCMLAAISCRAAKDYIWLIILAAVLFINALISHAMRPRNKFSKFHKPDITVKPFFKRAVILNIDGVRKDIFDALNLPTIGRLVREGTSHAFGLETIYRALTNPAFASIFTGTIPKFHGVRDNNFGQSIKTEGLPDIVPTIVYGSMHIKHFCKKYWQTRIVSLPRHSVYSSDDVMMGWLKEDMLRRDDIRLFVADFSEADFLAHAYGSRSNKYKEALRRIDKRIGDFIVWMEENSILDDTVVIVCSDHGIAAIDHSYLIFRSEKYVPFLIYGKGIKNGFLIQRPGKIMDICCTVAYLLGVRYPYDARGQVFTEAIEGSNLQLEQETLVNRFNQLRYDIEANDYRKDRVEIYEGDVQWWDECILKFAKNKKQSLEILDVGCGNGFVGQRFVAAGVNFREFICVDISNAILEEAKKALQGFKNFCFLNNLEDVKGKFDIITINSVFHHFFRPKKLADIIDNILSEDGIVIGSHEPNKDVFKNKLFYTAAFLYKNIGGGIRLSDGAVVEFNQLLHSRYPAAPTVCREEILQMAEYYSPLEQYDRSIDLQVGFSPDEFCKSYFPGYKILALETYTTFFYRPWLSRHRNIQSLLSIMFNILFRKGNLFRFVLRKNAKIL